MLSFEKVPQEYREEFDERAVEWISKLARDHALDDEAPCLDTIIGNMTNSELKLLPEMLRKKSAWNGYIARVMFNEMLNCFFSGAYHQKEYTEKHLRDMFKLCTDKGS